MSIKKNDKFGYRLNNFVSESMLFLENMNRFFETIE